MTREEIEARALRLSAKERARLASRLLESLEVLSEEEGDELWSEEAARRDAGLDKDPSSLRPAGEVHRDARSRLK